MCTIHSAARRASAATVSERDQVDVSVGNWDAVCSGAGLGYADRRLLWRRQFLNALAFEGLESPLSEAIEDSLKASPE